MYKIALAFISMFFLCTTPAGAAGSNDQKWVVTQLSGDARVVRPGLQPASLTVRTQLSAGDRLVTGPTGRATLVKGADYIVVAPRSEMRVPTAAQPTGFTRVVQTLGTLLFKVQHTGVPHFAVDTPMLAAVVKGTTFTVIVDQQRSAVQVTQGLVQVSANDGGMTRFVEGGKTVYVNHLAPKVLLDADKPLPASPAPSATSVTVSAETDAPLATIATLTDGLVRADLTAQPAMVTASTPVGTPVAETVRATGAAQPATTTAVVTTAVADTTVTPTTTAPTATSVTASTTVSTPVATPVSATVSVSTAPVVTASTPVVSVSTTPVVAATTPIVSVATTAPTVTAAVTTPIISTSTASITAPTITTTAVATPTVTVPAVTTPVVSTSPVMIPTVTVSSNSGPGSLNSGPGSLSSGSNSGPGSLSSGPSVTVAAISTPNVTVPAITTPIVPITTPTVTVPAITTPAVTVPAVTVPKVTVPSILSGL